MSDEKPVSLKRKVSSFGDDSLLTCIIHYEHAKDSEVRPLSESQFQSIQDACKVRQSQSTANNRLDSMCAYVPAQYDTVHHGAHRWCFKNFTNVSRLREHTELNVDVVASASRSSCRSVIAGQQSLLFPQHQCIFCGKSRRYGKRGSEALSKCETESAELTIKECAAAKQDHQLLGRIDGVDLRAKEARYHESCRRDYVRRCDRAHHQQGCEESSSSACEVKSAYSNAFEFLCQYVVKHVIDGGTVVRMSMLHDMYQNHMQTCYPDFYNANHTTQKLKNKLHAHFGDDLEFWRPQQKCKSELVFSSKIDVGEAVELAFDRCTSELKVLENAAGILRRHIKDAQSAAGDMPWPPSADFLKSAAASPPSSLVEFLAQVITGKSLVQATQKTHTVTASIAEDICNATTQGQWPMPKHILLGMTVRHLTGRADIVTILNRYGHCQSYPRIMELDTALACQVQKADSLLPCNISVSKNIVSHLAFDNFDINEETPSGAGTTHTTHGIVIQEASTSSEEVIQCTDQQRTRERSFKFVPPTLQPCYSKRRVEPVLGSVVEDSSSGAPVRSAHCVRRDVAWSICRALFNSTCSVPDWAGWISKTTADDDGTVSTVGYMRPILHPITEYATVQECLFTAMEVCKKVNQPIAFVTFDYAAARIAFDIAWDKPETFQNVIIHMGAFHTMCSYMGALGKMMAASGFEEVLIESGVCASGSIHQVMNGSHYNRAMRVHQHMVDGLERLLLERFVNEVSFDFAEVPEMASLAEDPSCEKLLEVLQSDSCNRFLDEYSNYKTSVRNGDLGKTAQFWLAYCDNVWLLLHFLESVKENNLPLYLQSLRQMCGLMFSADHLSYARYLPVYYVQLHAALSTQPEAYSLLSRYGISVSRSSVPGCRNAIDLTIEQTINRSAKTSGGIKGFSRNANAYYRWCLARHKRAEYFEAVMEQLGMASESPTVHKTTRPAELKRSERDVSNVVAAFRNFLNPFASSVESNDCLFCLSSGKPASAKVSKDLLQYTELGNQAADCFIKQRLKEKSVKFHAPLKKLRLQTFQSMAISKAQTTTQKKVVHVRAERNLLGQLLVLSQGSDINFDKLFKYPLAPVPWSLATADGGFMKTSKAHLMHHLEAATEQEQCCSPESGVYVVDGNALLQSMVRLPETFGAFALAILNTLPKGKTVHFVTDTYSPDSIKNAERSRRGTAPTYMVGGPCTKLPKDFSAFMRNSDNKMQLIKFLLSEWQSPQYARYISDRTIYYVCEDKCYRLQAADSKSVSVSPVQELFSSQEEADTRIVLHCLHAAQTMSDEEKLVVRSPDTDVFILLVAYACSIQKPVFFDTGTGNTRRQIAVSSIAAKLGHGISKALPGFHAFTGCDTTSAFVRKGKKAPFKLMAACSEYVEAFQQVGNAPHCMPSDVLHTLERYVCSMYGHPHLVNTNKVRSAIFQTRYAVRLPQSLHGTSRSGIDLSLLPPCLSSLSKHCLRANYQAFIWKQAHIASPHLPLPDGCGWIRDTDGNLQVDWFDGDLLPENLADIMEGATGADDEADTIANEAFTQAEAVEEDDMVDNLLDVVFDDPYDEDE